MLVALVLAVLVVTGCSRPLIPLKGSSGDLGKDEVKTKLETFINENLMQPGMKAEVKNVVSENGLYKATVSVGEGQEIDSYITKDGKIFFPDAINVEEIEKKVQEMKAQQQNADATADVQKEIPKTDKPTVDLYVMSFCPFGNKAEDTLKSVYDLLKNKVNFNFHYIVTIDGDNVTSLHGEKEVAQNEREACVLKNYGKDKWFSFVSYVNSNCGSDGACWEAGAKSVGVDSIKISACVGSQGVALMKENGKASVAAGANGSPTMIVNGVTSKVVYQYGNSETYKQEICGAFKKAPAECSKTLSTATTTAQGGSCATGNTAGN